MTVFYDGPNSCPPAYGGCRCLCHHSPGVAHVGPCCTPEGEPRGMLPEVWGAKSKAIERWWLGEYDDARKIQASVKRAELIQNAFRGFGTVVK